MQSVQCQSVYFNFLTVTFNSQLFLQNRRIVGGYLHTLKQLPTVAPIFNPQKYFDMTVCKNKRNVSCKNHKSNPRKFFTTNSPDLQAPLNIDKKTATGMS